ncbi:hypothetical protein [Aliarcobacter butzleri]|uniref:hypothetical protein n=1 Tax=Aliarcobacter butzleri TaxID=28197 RepID=UPI00126A4BCE|nr:hypothetical protein [Aliarcobacter butzleri]
MKSSIEVGHKIKCIKDLKSFCNGEEKIIFIKNKVYEVVRGVTGTPCIRIRENGDGYSFLNNSMDSYFQIIGLTDDVVITKENIHLYYEFMNDEDLIEIENHNNLVSDVIFNRKMDVYVLLIEKVDTKETEWIQCDNILNHEGFVLKYSLFGIKDTLKPIDEYIEEIKNSDTFKEFERDKLLQESIDITNVVIIDFSEDEVAEYIERCIKYLNRRFGSKYIINIWETDEIYGERDDEDDYSEEYYGHSMYQGKIALFDGVFAKDIKFTGTYCEISAVFSDLLLSLEIIEKETIIKDS